MEVTVDLVADLGEGFGIYEVGNDAELLPLLTSANVACGFHAGDPHVMRRTVEACVREGVAIGAHPSFPDLAGFGRRAMELTAEEIFDIVVYQIGALEAFVRSAGSRLRHVSPHGRLGNLAVTDATIANAIVAAVKSVDDTLAVYTQDGALAVSCRRSGLDAVITGLPDRAYTDDGQLVSRRLPGAIVHDHEDVARRAVLMVRDHTVRTINGNDLPIQCRSVLLHGDNVEAIESAKRIRAAFATEGIAVARVAASR